MVGKLVQAAKALVPIFDTFSEIVIDVKLVHPLKASLLISYIDPGIFMVVKLVQPWKVPVPIFDTFSGIVMDVKLVQPLKA